MAGLKDTALCDGSYGNSVDRESCMPKNACLINHPRENSGLTSVLVDFTILSMISAVYDSSHNSIGVEEKGRWLTLEVKPSPNVLSFQRMQLHMQRRASIVTYKKYRLEIRLETNPVEGIKE